MDSIKRERDSMPFNRRGSTFSPNESKSAGGGESSSEAATRARQNRSVSRGCAVDDCDQPVWFRGYCVQHYGVYVSRNEDSSQKRPILSTHTKFSKFFAGKTSQFSFGQKFMNTSAQLVMEVVREIATAFTDEKQTKKYLATAVKVTKEAKATAATTQEK